jgi:inward rectifier potassium channel
MQQHSPQLPPSAAARPGHRRAHDKTMPVQFGAFELRKRGAARYDWRDPYHFFVSITWPKFALLFLLLNLGINVLFAGLYLLQPGSIANARPGVFSDVFFFSMETLATVGYGAMSPATLYGHSIAAAEIICGMAFSAIMTGLTFVRFSRAKAKILYADRPVVATRNGRPTLMIRIANGRPGMLVGAKAELGALIGEQTQEGQFFRRIHDMKLMRGRLHMFPLTWTLMHEIDEASPLYGLDGAQLVDRDFRMFVSVTAHDYALGADVYDAKTYAADDIAWGMRYADAVSIDEAGRTIADLSRLSLIEPHTLPHAGATMNGLA